LFTDKVNNDGLFYSKYKMLWRNLSILRLTWEY